MTCKVFLEAHPIQQGQTECAVLQVIYAVMVRCPEMVENVILHDAAIVHLADTVKNFLEVGGWEVLQHAPYSPDLGSPCSDLILGLHGKQFSNGEHFISSLAQGSTSCNDDGVYVLFHHWQQTIDSLEDYFYDC
jgi:hypothetical protein